MTSSDHPPGRASDYNPLEILAQRRKRIESRGRKRKKARDMYHGRLRRKRMLKFWAARREAMREGLIDGKVLDTRTADKLWRYRKHHAVKVRSKTMVLKFREREWLKARLVRAGILYGLNPNPLVLDILESWLDAFEAEHELKTIEAENAEVNRILDKQQASK